MMTSTQIRTSSQVRKDFLDFFKSKQHAIVPSSSLMPDSPNLLFTNAGMNQFVPIFLGQVKCPYKPGRAADTQKCIRAGGKHNDLEDVGLDTYHHTFFEMLGNWSFGDYFKKESLEWGWELLTKVWKFPTERLYATVYKPGKGEPSEFDQETYDIWVEIFKREGLDPKKHIVFGNKKDSFWMMGDTGPCGPCSEIHMDLTPAGDTKGSLVNKSDARCIEIWNHVFIQFNANPDGTFSPLPAKHVDTGMGFERATSIIQCTKGFKDFTNAKVSNYETDIFRPIFDILEKLSGVKYHSTLPGAELKTENLKLETVHQDIAFRVVADHIRTLSFAIADGVQPSNEGRGYVLRRILRRAVRYGRTLGFHEPFFYKLVDVLADTMGDVFPEILAKKKHVQDVIRTEEEAFNKTLDNGIEMFNAEAARLTGFGDGCGMGDGTGYGMGSGTGAGFADGSGFGGSAPAPGAAVSASLTASCMTLHPGSKYSKRCLPHFERPWAKYMVTFATHQHRQLTPVERDIVLASVLYAHEHRQYQLFAACVMSDHVHILFEPQIKEQDKEGKPVFWSLAEISQGIKSTTAHRINKAAGKKGEHVWEEESFDRIMRGDADLEEKFHYICRNPWDNGVVPMTGDYRWLWTLAQPTQAPSREISREGARNDARGGRAPHATLTITGEFAFKLYDTYGFPLDLTELMARERGLTVDVAGFNKLMEEQRTRARAAQKKTVISLSQIETTTPTKFVGYDRLETPAKVLEVVSLKEKTAVILDTSACYAEGGGQIGDTGELKHGSQLWRVTNTQKSGNTWLHILKTENLKLETPPATGSTVMLSVDANRRRATERHHTVTHLLHWALHEVVGKNVSQKGSFVGPDKLTFDFNSAPLTPQQVADVEKLVNERIVENASVSWTEVPYADIKSRKDIRQFFGEKYGDMVRVLQVGGTPGALNGYSMELCGGTHVRATGEIGLFRIVGESAIAAGVRRIEAIAGLEAYRKAADELCLIKSLANKVNSPVGELEKKIEALLENQKVIEKQLKAAQQREASNVASRLLEEIKTINGVPAIIHNLGAVDGDFLQAVADSLKSQFKGVIVLGGGPHCGSVALVAAVTPDFTAIVQAGKIIQQIAPIVGGKGGGKPDNARGGGKDESKLDEALAKAKTLLGN